MSNISNLFVIIGDSEHEQAEQIAPKVAEAIRAFIGLTHALPVISTERDDWESLQNGNKAAGSAAIWFGWNYAQPEKLEEHLKAEGFTNITVWSHHEFGGSDGKAPRVVSW